MQITTVMVVMLIVWCVVTMAERRFGLAARHHLAGLSGISMTAKNETNDVNSML